MRRILTQPQVVVLVALGAVLGVAGGAVYASIPSSDGTIHGCYQKGTGALRVIDADARQTCGKNETPLLWKQLTSVDELQGLACTLNTKPGTVSVSTDTGGNISLKCVAPQTTLSIAPPSALFTHGSQSAVFTVTNTGAAGATILNVVIPDLGPVDPFLPLTDGCSGQTLPPAGSCQITVTTQPVPPPPVTPTLHLTVISDTGGEVVAPLTVLP